MKTLEELAAMDHPYYCSESNFYKNFKTDNRFSTMSKFLYSFEESDIDMNLCFRWDVNLKDDNDISSGYCAEVFLMQQRKGIFYPCIIKHFKENEVHRFLRYLEKHRKVMNKFWCEL